ncbi:hypothetical protein BGW38_005458 [Lunasporangiospora selenospora]|uniref:Vacuole protein n=1 Tax=Lunasporangiospora selenospora TaxID=979761 RepID=A0A9P6FNU4_9FUNG|nr:hypothetical protein BGW38_005458 [Lunasporangiospora selenospora]
MGAHWKREKVQDHKFDFINVEDFVDNSCWRQFTYSLVFAAIIRGILVYCSDIFTAANLLANSNENSFIPDKGVEFGDLGKLPFDVYKYLFTGCIILSFILLGFDMHRARGIVASRDISYAFTSLISSRYYTVRSYPHFCFFSQINNSKKTVDEVAFFCFFTFRNWKRLMLADAPRQVINATILYQTFKKPLDDIGFKGVFDWNLVVGEGDKFLLKKIALGGMIFTVFMFVYSLLQLIAAAILYIPLVSHIQGNLKEIDELIRIKSRTRAKDQAKNGKDIALANLKQPTLPQVDILDTPVNSDTEYLQQHQGRGDGGYGHYGAGTGGDPSYYNYRAGPAPPRPGRYDDYAQQRPASPIQSQHGSDLDSHHSSGIGGRSAAGGYNGYGNARYPGGGYNNNNNNNNNTGQSWNQYRNGNGY